MDKTSDYPLLRRRQNGKVRELKQGQYIATANGFEKDHFD